jgi:Protein of unknown function (DUF3572)
MTPRVSRYPVDRQNAEVIAVSALSFLASRPRDLDRFFALTGLSSDTIRQDADKPGFLAGVLDYLVGDEPLLTAFAAEAGVPPQQVDQARQRLDTPD